MKRIIFSLLLISQASFGAATYYIEPGTTSFGAGRGALSGRVTVSLTGAPSSQQRIFNYFDFSGTLSIALPPDASLAHPKATQIEKEAQSPFWQDLLAGKTNVKDGLAEAKRKIQGIIAAG